MKVSRSSETKPYKCGGTDGLMFFILTSPFVSLIGNVNTTGCLYLAMVLVGYEGISPSVSSSKILTSYQKERQGSLWTLREAHNQLKWVAC